MASFFKRFTNFFTKTSGSVLLKLLDQNKGSDIEDSYRAYAMHCYAGNPFGYACVREIATSAASIPWKVMRRSNQPLQPDEEIFDKNDPLKKLISSPANGLSWQQFIEQLITYLEIGGETFIRGILIDNNSRISELQLLRPDRIEINRKYINRTEAREYQYIVDGVLFDTYSTEEVLQIRFVNPLDDLHGLSPFRSARRSVGMNNEARRWNQKLLQNDARPSGAFSVKGELSDDQIQGIRELINTRFSGPENSRRPLLLQGETQWLNLGYSPGEMDWLGGMDSSTREICSALNVPEELVGGSRKTYENYTAALKGLYTENILPLLDMISGSLNLWLVPRVTKDSDLYLTYDATVVDVLQDEADKLYKRANNATYMSIDERREIVKLVPLGKEKGGNVVLVSTASIPLEAMADKKPPANGNPPKPTTPISPNPPIITEPVVTPE